MMQKIGRKRGGWRSWMGSCTRLFVRPCCIALTLLLNSLGLLEGFPQQGSHRPHRIRVSITTWMTILLLCRPHSLLDKSFAFPMIVHLNLTLPVQFRYCVLTKLHMHFVYPSSFCGRLFALNCIPLLCQMFSGNFLLE